MGAKITQRAIERCDRNTVASGDKATLRMVKITKLLTLSRVPFGGGRAKISGERDTEPIAAKAK